MVLIKGPDSQLYERICNQAFSDRVWRVREGGCHLLRHTLDETLGGGHFDGKVI